MSDEQNKHNPPSSPSPEHGWSGLITVAATLLTVLTATAAMVGYGVTLAVESTFALPHGSAFDSLIDLLDLSSIAIAHIVDRVGSGLFDPHFYKLLYQSQWPLVAGLAICWTAFALGRNYLKARLPVIRARLQKEPSRPGGPARLHWGHHVLAVMVAAAAPLLAVAGIGVVFLALTVTAILPLIGYEAGKSSIKRWIVEPALCLPVLSRQARMNAYDKPASKTKERGVSCVKVSKDAAEIARGRVILSTTKAILLFDPATGVATRVPLSDASVEAIGHLEAPRTPEVAQATR